MTGYFDFSQEDDQQEYKPFGPVPAGSVVIVRMEILPAEGDYADPTDNLVQIGSNSGLRLIYCQFEVTKGSYAGVTWRQVITLPQGMQPNRNFSAKQLTACRIGGSLLKAILTSAAKSMNVRSLADFNGLIFPVKVKINKKSSEYQGQEYWKNEIASVILPDNPQYQGIRQAQEYINEKGAVTYIEKSKTNNSLGTYELPDSAFDNSPSATTGRNRKLDEVPF